MCRQILADADAPDGGIVVTDPCAEGWGPGVDVDMLEFNLAQLQNGRDESVVQLLGVLVEDVAVSLYWWDASDLIYVSKESRQ